MTTPLILNVVSTKHLLHVYHCQQIYQCSLSSIFIVQSVFKFMQFKWLLKKYGGFGVEPMPPAKGTAPLEKA